jgi:hypothetical protein
MKKCDSILLRVFLCGLPLVALLAVFCHLYDAGSTSPNAYLRGLNALAGLVLATSMALSVYLSIRLIVSGPFRDQVLTRLTFMRERDEREAMMTGKAARTTFLASLAVLVFLFCLSCFQVSVYRLPPEKAINGKTGVVTLGVGFHVVEHPDRGVAGETSRRHLFAYKGLPLSSPAVILILLVWQVLFYNFSVRRLAK